jgi:putative peptide zinc metalloprotease protein
MEKAFPRYREDLIESQQKFEGKTYFVIKDPLTSKFFRIKEYEHFITQKLDGKTSLEKVKEEFEKNFQILLPPETLEQFVGRLKELGFLEGEIPSRELSKTGFKWFKKEDKSFLNKILFIKIKAFNPEKLLDWLYKYFKFIFTPYFSFFAVAVIILGAIITLSNWEILTLSLSPLFKLTTLIKVWLAIFLLLVLHEFSHSLTCKHFGGKVSEMGFLLLYFQPCFYCNVSEAWLFEEKSKKLWVTFAGTYFNLFAWGFSTILWRITDTETDLNLFFYVLMIVAGMMVIFNLNPLIKLDGYYLLSDYLEIPNLRKKAFAYLGSGLRKFFLKSRERLVEFSRREKKIFTSYGALSLVYSFLLLVWIFAKLNNFLVSQLQGWGFVLFLGLFFYIFKKPGLVFVAGFFQFALLQKEEMKKPKKLITYLSIVILVLIILLAVKLNLKVSRECEIAPLEYYSILNYTNGFIEERSFRQESGEKKTVNLFKLISNDYNIIKIDTRIKEGQRVFPGDTLAYVGSVLYLSSLGEAESNLKKARSEYELLKKGARKEEMEIAQEKVKQTQVRLDSKTKDWEKAKQLHNQKLISDDDLRRFEDDKNILEKQLGMDQNNLKILKDGAKKEELDIAFAEMKRCEARLEFIRDQVNASTVLSPIPGIVTNLEGESSLLTVANLDTMKIFIKASEKDMGIIKLGEKVRAKVRTYPGKTFVGQVTKIAYQPNPTEKKKIYIITCKIPNSELLLKPGMTGQAKIYCGKRNILTLLTRRLVRYLRVEFWSWW